jgi:uncharacterized membrane protein
MEFVPEMAAALQALLEDLAETSPESQEVLDQAKQGHLTEDEAMKALLEIAAADPEMGLKLQASANLHLAPLRDAAIREKKQATGVLFTDSTGTPKLNPLYEAALIERTQFDGDIPELRTGPLPVGVKPAVPVATDARSPAALGQMLHDASEQVGEVVESARKERVSAVAHIAEGLPQEEISADLQKIADDIKAVGTEMAVRGTPATDPAVYRRGEAPMPVRVARPTGSALARLSPKDRRENAWKFLSTTQGRRTALPTVAALVLEQLQGAGLHVEEGSFDPDDPEVVARHLWSVVLAEQGAIQSSFSFIEVAARALGRALTQAVEGESPSQYTLMVQAHNDIPNREVGWSARLRRTP